MIYFDRHTLSDWAERGVDHISCTIISSGCAGATLVIEEYPTSSLGKIITLGSLRISLSENDFTLLDESTITRVGKKWIVKNASINTHCGCGKSFSFKSGNALTDKIERTKLALKKKKEGIHA